MADTHERPIIFPTSRRCVANVSHDDGFEEEDEYQSHVKEAKPAPTRKQRDQDNDMSMAIYANSLQAADAEITRGRIDRLVQEGEAAREGDEAEELEVSSEWRWVEGANYFINTRTGARTFDPPRTFNAAAADLPAEGRESMEERRARRAMADNEVVNPAGRRAMHTAAAPSPIPRFVFAASIQDPAVRAAQVLPDPAPAVSSSSAPRSSVAAALTDEAAANAVSVQDAYNHAARLARETDRDATTTIQLRRASNFVKDGPLRVCIAFWAEVLRGSGGGGGAGCESSPPPWLEVLDLCCGRGQDFDKFRRACRDSGAILSKLVGADVAAGATTRSAQDKWAQVATMARRDSEILSSRAAETSPSPSHPAPRAAVMMGGALAADLAEGHAGRAIDDAAERAGWDTDSLPAHNSFHLTTCFFALHYFFRDEGSFRSLVAGASWLTREGGFFATIHADGEAIASAFRASGGSEPRFRVGQATLTLADSTAAMLNAEGQDVRNPFGWAYGFHLPGAVENVTEYLVHSPTRDRMLEAAHFVKVFDESAERVMHRMRGVQFWREAFAKTQVDCGTGSLSEDTLDHLALYRVAIYVKSPLRVDVAPVKRYIRAKLGFAE